MLVNHLPTEIVEHFENAANEEIFRAVIEDVGAGEERKRGHDVSREVVYPHALRFRRRGKALFEEKMAVPEHLQRLQRNLDNALQEIGELQ